ncbi:hypothetical protein HMPREF2580_04025 [Staphylococcus sp. HMSC036D05]|uniref:hypothetical protein n=1 Tax=Staphylococcus sp. HMSC036D05 TaxID=1715059 RepID=UPI00091849AE|nr:hypothetical protein [Staphylococcus sp. HMSC036D05]OHO72677.1 hypothetical protein HMPREF2580_04025 [Staphylococcus sp. HMSC036D05]
MNISVIINYIDKFKKQIEERYSIPLHYGIFGFALIIWYLKIPIDKLIEGFNDELKKTILHTFSLVYNHILACFLISFLFVLIINLIFEKMNLSRLVPPDKEYTDGTVSSINYIYAMKKLIYLPILIVTKYWIFYFLVVLLFNKGKYMYLSDNSIIINEILMVLNTLILFVYIIRSVFILRIPVDDTLFRIKANELENYYIILNGNNNYYIIKPKYRGDTTYYLVKKYQLTLEKSNYEIINKSKKLDEIIYHFDYLSS